MNKIVDKKKRINFQNYSPVVIFLILEVIAFVTFSFANSFLLYSILGLIILALIILVTYKEIKIDGLVKSGFFIFPLFVFGLITVLSNYFKINQNIDIVTKVFIPISLVVFSSCGAILSLNKSFKISTALFVTYSTLAVVTLINFIMTIAQFGPFHTIFYQNYHMYYGGQISSVGLESMAYALVGYQFKEVTIGFYSLFPSLLLTSSIMLFFISYKNEKWKFISYLCFTILAFLTLLFTSNILSLITDALIILIIVVLILFSKKILPGKAILIGIIVILALALIGVTLLFLNAQSWSWLSGYQNFIASNSFLNKLFNTNYIVKNVNAILNDMFSSFKLFGFYYQNSVNDIPINPSNSWLFDNIFTSGFFGAIFYLFSLVIGFLGLKKYMKYSDDDVKDKTLLFALIISYFVYTLISGDVYYLIFGLSYNFFFISGPYLIIILFLGYANSNGRKAKQIFMERSLSNETQIQ